MCVRTCVCACPLTLEHVALATVTSDESLALQSFLHVMVCGRVLAYPCFESCFAHSSVSSHVPTMQCAVFATGCVCLFACSPGSYCEVDALGECSHDPSGFVYNVNSMLYTAPAGFANAHSHNLRFTYDSATDVFEQWDLVPVVMLASPPVELPPGALSDLPVCEASGSDTDEDWSETD